MITRAGYRQLADTNAAAEYRLGHRMMLAVLLLTLLIAGALVLVAISRFDPQRCLLPPWFFLHAYVTHLLVLVAGWPG